MTCLACGQVHDDAIEVTLHDGRVVSSYSEEWRQECEARAVLAMPNRNDRTAFLGNVKRHRGEAAALALRELVTVLWGSRLANQRQAG